MDALALGHAFHKLVFGRVVAVGETIPVTCEGRALLLRVTCTNNLEEEEQVRRRRGIQRCPREGLLCTPLSFGVWCQL